MVRGRFRCGRIVGALLCVVVFIGACGGDDGDDGFSGADADADDVDPTGVLRYGTSLEVALGVHFDPTHAPNVVNNLWLKAIYGTLVRETPEGTYEPWMAEDVEVVDSQTVRITLRPGVQFTDGAPYDAQAVRDGLMRTRFQPASQAVIAGMGSTFRAMESAEVVDPSTVLVHLSAPVAGEFVNILAEKEGAIVSPKQVAEAPGQIETAPVGAGPFVLDSYEPSVILRLRKNDAFFDADEWRLGGIDFVHATPGGPSVNGLLAGALDYIVVPSDSRERISSDDEFGTASIFNELSPYWMNMCQDKPPFDDPDVRRAFSLAIDREQIAEVIFGDAAEPSSSWELPDSPNYEPDTEDLVRYDPEEAERLLRGRRVDVPVYLTAPGVTDASRMMELVQGQVAKVGFDMTITPTQDIVAEFIQPQKAGAYPGQVTRVGVEKYTRVFSPGSSANMCSTPRTDVVSAIQPAAMHGPGDPRRAEAYRRAQTLIAENTYAIMLVRVPTLAGWSADRVGGEPAYGGGRGELLFDSLYIRT